MERRFTHLDFIRGASAIVVAATHLRSLWLPSFADLKSHSKFDEAFYYLTGLGPQAVIVFFVLSGFFVGGSVLTAHRTGRWTWSAYLINRLSRLWVVLLPALVFTSMMDHAGLALSNGFGYGGQVHHQIHLGPAVEQPLALGSKVFCGNLLFLQTIVVPIYGSNDPLWSLAWEFWYYLLFPLLIGSILRTGGMTSRVIHGAIFVTLILWLPANIRWNGLVWLFGVGTHLVISRPSAMKWCGSWPFFACAMIAMGVSSLSWRYHWAPASEYWLGLSCAAALPCLCRHKVLSPFYQRVAQRLSDVSYTLYLFHFPFLIFVSFVFWQHLRFQPSLASYLLYGCALVLLVLWSFVPWWLFERNTGKVRKWAAEWVKSR